MKRKQPIQELDASSSSSSSSSSSLSSVFHANNHLLSPKKDEAYDGMIDDAIDTYCNQYMSKRVNDTDNIEHYSVRQMVEGKGASKVESHNGDRDVYFAHKILRLQDQIVNNSHKKTDIFKGCYCFFNGSTDPPKDELTRLIHENGGDVDLYQVTRVTHFVCNYYTYAQLSAFHSKKAASTNILSKIKHVTVKWILESVEQGKRLDESLYIPAGFNLYGQNIQHLITKQNNAIANANAATTTTTTTVENNINSSSSNSSSSSNDVAEFYNHSRLHFIGTWRSKLPEMVKAYMLANRNNTTSSHGSSSASVERVVLHIDMDCFFVTVLLRNTSPDRQKLPVAVAHSGTADYSEISSCNYPARSYGVANGMWMKQARERCPDLVVMKYDFEAYRQVADIVYSILFSSGALHVEPVSIDEAYLEFAPGTCGVTVASTIRNRIYSETRCNASAGVSYNKLLAKIATGRAKPNGQFLITASNSEDFLRPLPLGELPGIGASKNKILVKMNLHTCGDIWPLQKYKIQQSLGDKLGSDIYDYSRGIDHRPLEIITDPKSVSSVMNYAIRFTTEDDAKVKFGHLSSIVEARLAGYRSSRLTVKLMIKKAGSSDPKKYNGHGVCDDYSSTSKDTSSIHSKDEIFNKAYPEFQYILREHQKPIDEVRGIGITMTDLVNIHSANSTAYNGTSPSKMKQTTLNVGSIEGGDGTVYKSVFGLPTNSSSSSSRINKSKKTGNYSNNSTINCRSDTTTSTAAATAAAMEWSMQSNVTWSQHEFLVSLTPETRRDAMQQLEDNHRQDYHRLDYHRQDNHRQGNHVRNLKKPLTRQRTIRSMLRGNSEPPNETSCDAIATATAIVTKDKHQLVTQPINELWNRESMVTVSKALHHWIYQCDGSKKPPTAAHYSLLCMYASWLVETYQLDQTATFVRMVRACVEGVSYDTAQAAVLWKELVEGLEMHVNELVFSIHYATIV